MLLEVKNLCFSYYKKPLCIKDVSFGIKKGQKILLCGAKDSGKTTLIKVLSGFEESYFGSIKIEEKEIKYIPDAEKNVSFLPSVPVFFEKKTISQNFDFASEISGNEKLSDEEKTKICNDFFIEKDINEKVKKLSLFEKRVLAISRSLLKNPRIIFLDDQFENLSENEKQNMQKIYKTLIKRNDLTIIFACGSETFKENREFLNEAKFDNVLFLSMAGVTAHKSAQNLVENMPTIDIMPFLGNYQNVDGIIVEKENQLYFVIDDDLFFKFSKEHEEKLRKLNILKNDGENSTLLILEETELEHLSDEEFNKLLKTQKFVIFSLLDGKRLI